MSGAITLPDRQAFKELVAQALGDYVPSCTDRIMVGRGWPQQSDGLVAVPQFPALLLQDGPRLHRLAAAGFVELRLQLRILARVQNRDLAAREALLDEIEMQVRDAVFTAPILQAGILATEEMASERDLSVEGETAIGQDAHLVTFKLGGFL